VNHDIPHYGNPTGEYDYKAPATGTRSSGQQRSLAEKVEQTRAIRALVDGFDTMLYAARMPDGTIKIGCTSDLASRFRYLRAMHGVMVGFIPGSFDDEADIHSLLKPYLAMGQEWYHPAPQVIDTVNQMRDRYDLPHLAA